jgi:dTDP-4-dehydrorhamnose 3,5-epimerase
LGHYNKKAMTEVGIRDEFVQDNQSFSCRNVLRGLHYQARRPQSAWWPTKSLMSQWDLRRSSPTFGRWHGVNLSG